LSNRELPSTRDVAPIGDGPAGAAAARAMTAEELLPRVKRLVVDALRLDGLRPDEIADDEPLVGGRLGLDSVDLLELVVALERELGVAVPGEAIGGEAFASPRALAAWLAAHPAAAALDGAR
jgi:acyl carrier protein